MPVTFADSDIKRVEGQWTALPEDLDLLPELNGRHTLPDIEPLIASILAVGQLQPVPIRKTGGRPLLTAGYSRYRAIEEINRRKLTADPLRLICTFKTHTDKQAFIATIHENHVRNVSTPMDDAYNIQKLLQVFQVPMEEIADTYRATLQWVKDRLVLLEVAPEVETAIRENRIKAPAAVKLAKLSRDVQKAVVSKPGKVTAGDVKAATPKSAPAPVKSAPKPTASVSLREAITALLDEAKAQKPTGMVYEIHVDTIAAIRDAANQSRTGQVENRLTRSVDSSNHASPALGGRT